MLKPNLIKRITPLLTTTLLCLHTASALAANTIVQPDASIPVGDSPFSIALSNDGLRAVVVNLYPSNGFNTSIISLPNRSVLNQLQVGTRLVAVQTTGDVALQVNEDQDFIRVVNLLSGAETTQIQVGNRPSNIAVSADGRQAISTNGTSGDLSVIDLTTYTVTKTIPNVGTDPRAVAFSPTGNVIFVVNGKDNDVVAIDLATGQILSKVGVGKNPTSLAISSNGVAVVLNLGRNTATLVDVSNSNSLRKLTEKDLPVGFTPNSVTIGPEGTKAYIVSLTSNFLTVVDLQKHDIEGFVQLSEGTGVGFSSVRFSKDGRSLLYTKFSQNGELNIVDVSKLVYMEEKPKIRVPGEPVLSNKSLTGPGYYIVSAQKEQNAKEGTWGVELLVEKNILSGGINLGGGFQPGSPNTPSTTTNFAGFSLAVPQTVTLKLEPTGNASQGRVTINLMTADRKPVAQKSEAFGNVLQFNQDLQPGFYVVEIVGENLTSDNPGFLLGMTTSQYFTGGVVIGGYASETSTGFAGFNIPSSQKVNVRVFGPNEYGEDVGAGGMFVKLLNDQHQEIAAAGNTSAMPAVQPPSPPDVTGIPFHYYVDAEAGNDSNDGSLQRPFKSITKAVNTAQAGQNLFVQPGTYSIATTGEMKDMNGNFVAIGSQGYALNGFQSNVKLIGAGAANTIIDGTGSPFSPTTNIIAIGVDGIQVSGFTIKNSKGCGIYVINAKNVTITQNLLQANTRFGFGAGGAINLSLKNNVASENFESGIAVAGTYAGTSALIEGNTATENIADGILVSQGGNVIVRNNTVIQNGVAGIEYNNRQEGAVSGFGTLTGSVIDNVAINNGGRQWGFAGNGILAIEGASLEEISGNRVENNTPFGISLSINSKVDRIINNTSSKNASQGISVQRDSYVRLIDGNTIDGNELTGIFVESNQNLPVAVEQISNNKSTNNRDSGMSVLKSVVNTVSNNAFTENRLGIEVALTSRIGTFQSNHVDKNEAGGIIVRDNSSVAASTSTYNNNGFDRGHGISVTAQSVYTDNGSEVLNNVATGIDVVGSTANLENMKVQGNGESGGIFASLGAQVTVNSSTIADNVGRGVIASGNGATVRIAGNTTVSGTKLDPQGQAGFGLDAPPANSGQVTCSNRITITGNAGAAVSGNVVGCQ